MGLANSFGGRTERSQRGLCFNAHVVAERF